MPMSSVLDELYVCIIISSSNYNKCALMNIKLKLHVCGTQELH